MNTPTAATSDASASSPIRIVMPHQLRALAGVRGEIVVEVAAPVTLAATLAALESAHPALVGTIRDRASGRRRDLIRIYADGDDLSNGPADTPLPPRVLTGHEPIRLVGAIAGG